MKLRLRFRKGHSVRWLSHLDLSRAWVRAIIRAKLPLAYSEGFTPHPKLAFGPALPVGVSGESEYFDVGLVGHVEPAEAMARINAVAPAGLEVTGGTVLPEGVRVPALAASIAVADYTLLVADVEPAEAKELLTRHNIIGKTGDGGQAGPVLRSLEAHDGKASVSIRVPILFKPLSLGAGEIGDPNFAAARIDRLALWVIINGRLVDPLTAVDGS